MKTENNDTLLNDFDRSPQLSELKVSYRYSDNDTQIIQGKRWVLNEAETCFEFLKAIWDRDTIELREEVILVCLHQSLQVKGWMRLHAGGYHSCSFDVKFLFGVILKTASSAFVLAYNHPSGSLIPSREDHSLTHRIDEIAKLLQIRMVDNLIITSKGYYSSRLDDPGIFQDTKRF